MPQRTICFSLTVLSQKMPPKIKKKVHTIPEEHPEAILNSECRSIQVENVEEGSRKTSRTNRKLSNCSAASSPINDTNISNPLQYVTSLKENDAQENIILLLLSSPHPGTSSAKRQEPNHAIISSKVDHPSAQETPPIKTQFEDIKVKQNTTRTKHRRSCVSLSSQSTSQNLPRNCLEVEKLHKDQQASTQLGARSKKAPFNMAVKGPLMPQNLISRTSAQETLHVANQSEVSKTPARTQSEVSKTPQRTQSEERRIQKIVAEIKQKISNVSLTSQSSLQSPPLNYSEAEKLHKDQQANTQLEARSKKAPYNRAVKEQLVPQNLISRTSVQETLHVESQSEVPKTPARTQFEECGIQKSVAEIKQHGSNASCTSQSLQSPPLNYSEVEKLFKELQANPQLVTRVKRHFLYNRTLKEPLMPRKLICTCEQAKSLIATQTDEETEIKRKKTKFSESLQNSPQSIHLNHADGVILQVGETKTQEEFGDHELIKKMKGNETLTPRKPIKDTKCVKCNLNLVPIQTHILEKYLLQQKIEKIESELKLLEEQKKRLLLLASSTADEQAEMAVSGIRKTDKEAEMAVSEIKKSAKEPKMAISGFIAVFTANESERNNGAKARVWDRRNSDEVLLQIKDQNMKVIIALSKGTQVICNRRERTIVYSGLGEVEPCSRTLEEQDAVTSDKDVRSDPEQYEKTPNSSNSNEVSVFSEESISTGVYSDLHIESCSGTLEDQDAIKLDKNVRSDSKHHEETKPDTSVVSIKENIAAGVYSDIDVESCFRTLEDQDTIKSDKDVRSDPEYHEESATYSSKSIEGGIFSEENISAGVYSVLDVEPYSGTLEDQDAVELDKAVRSDPEHPEEAPKASSNSIGIGILSEICMSIGVYLDLNVESSSRTLEDQDIFESDKDGSDDHKHHEDSKIDSSVQSIKENISSTVNFIKERIPKVCKNFFEILYFCMLNLVTRMLKKN